LSSNSDRRRGNLEKASFLAKNRPENWRAIAAAGRRSVPNPQAGLDTKTQLWEASPTPIQRCSEYRDLYNDRLRELIEAKVEGREVATAPTTNHPPTINLIEALKASLGQNKRTAARRAPAKKTATTRKRKTG
jgi:non-homologous end joining protein Ku